MVQAGATIVLQSFFCAIDFTFNSHQRQSFPLCALCKAVYYSHSTRYVSFRLDFRFVFVFFLLLFEMLSGWATTIMFYVMAVNVCLFFCVKKAPFLIH